ncbi:metallopeptidase [Geobacillus subterraneus]|uniref:Metallopeptidase n=2 Tax=Geobacillus TaxID=129337 RepID=A0ABM6A936_9BACL|nr:MULTISPECIES: Xaa-Pro peptidase family protein [Geobacillus]AMX82625.1 metallopeptidase [Geobacillus subterraneus]KZS26293.1 metallopeptidase [Geobacillus subterraneus]OXB90716.1 peptidase M24 family protein [Geobacillus uzenensis]QIZ68652.1 aminopeptidase P family protein [Geobacillus subterraneus]WPZ17676.1 Xaa-Pro peptidase family protein [Geobacillus subterraneus]
MNQRLQAFSSWLQQQHSSFALITSSANVFYFSGFWCDPHERLLALLVFPEGEPVLVCPQMEVPRARRAGWEDTVIGYDDSTDPWEEIHRHLQRRNINATIIAVEKHHLSFARFERLSALFPNAQWQDAEEKLRQLRLMKDEEEMKRLRQAAELADRAIEIGVSAIRPGVTELELVAVIEYELKKLGVEGMSFPTTVLTGARTADPHGVPGAATVAPGDFVLFDLGVIVDGYCSDITRTVVCRMASDEQRLIYDTVRRAQQAAIDACRPQIAMGEIDRAARSVIEQAGYGPYFPHRVGHGLGIDIHEYPSLHSTNHEPLVAGMVFTIEPGIYVPAIGGVRIEDDVAVTASGVEVLTSFSKDLIIV